MKEAYGKAYSYELHINCIEVSALPPLRRSLDISFGKEHVACVIDGALGRSGIFASRMRTFFAGLA